MTIIASEKRAQELKNLDEALDEAVQELKEGLEFYCLATGGEIGHEELSEAAKGKGMRLQDDYSEHDEDNDCTMATLELDT